MKYVESNLPYGYELQVRHYHDGNSTREERAQLGTDIGAAGSRYVTRAVILDAEGARLSSGVASCGSMDNPCRMVGREVAVGRAMKGLFER